MDKQTDTQDNKEEKQEQFTEYNPFAQKDKEWIAWRKAKRDGRLSEHRKMLRSSAYRKMKKSEASQEDRERTK